MSRVHYFILTTILICLICSLDRLLHIHINIVRYISNLSLFVLLIWPSIVGFLEKIVLLDLFLAFDVMCMVRLIIMVLLNQLLQEVMISLTFNEFFKVYFWLLSLCLENSGWNYVLGGIRRLRRRKFSHFHLGLVLVLLLEIIKEGVLVLS